MSRRLVDEDDLSDQRLYTDEEIHVFYGQLVERLKAEGVYREDEDESKEKPMQERTGITKWCSSIGE